ncbi:MAG: hypothetical protein JRI94_13925 [Deltaproteobacteria bacterium]|nr:hypothetical protein [Deltaproteobacteria bacterium]
MKKILLFALAALLVVAWAMPVMAKVHMGGIVFVKFPGCHKELVQH